MKRAAKRGADMKSAPQSQHIGTMGLGGPHV